MLRSEKAVMAILLALTATLTLVHAVLLVQAARDKISVLYSHTPSSGIGPVFVGLIVATVGVASLTGLIYVRRTRNSKLNPSIKKFAQKLVYIMREGNNDVHCNQSKNQEMVN